MAKKSDKPKKNGKKGPGKPKKEITPAQMRKAEKHAYNGCKNGTIEGLMEWSDAFIAHRPDISRRLTKKRQKFLADLGEAQRNKAIVSKDTTMQIFLGKNYLDQADKREDRVSGDIHVHIKD